MMHSIQPGSPAGKPEKKEEGGADHEERTAGSNANLPGNTHDRGVRKDLCALQRNTGRNHPVKKNLSFARELSDSKPRFFYWLGGKMIRPARNSTEGGKHGKKENPKY